MSKKAFRYNTWGNYLKMNETYIQLYEIEFVRWGNTTEKLVGHSSFRRAYYEEISKNLWVKERICF